MAWFKPKVAKADYTPGMLPTTHREVFFDVVKLHTRKLLICGFLSFLFTLPFLVSSLMETIFQGSLYERSMAGEISGEAALLSLTTYQNLSAMADILFFMLLAVGLAGLARAVKRFAWEENVDVFHDFAKGVGQNGKQFLLLGLLTGLAAFLCGYVRRLLAGSVIAYLPTVLCAALLGPVAGYMTVTIAVYQMRFRAHIRYALILYTKNVPGTLLASLACAAVFIPQFLPNFYCQVIGRLVTGWLLPFVMLGWFLFTFEQLDKSINPAHYPELVGRGLFPPVK